MKEGEEFKEEANGTNEVLTPVKSSGTPTSKLIGGMFQL
jgi:hypothetical protein